MTTHNRLHKITFVTIVGLGAIWLAYSRIDFGSKSERARPPRDPQLISREIRTLEERIASKLGSFQEKAELAGILASEAKLTGDTTLFDRAEKLALESLKDLPEPNHSAKLVLAHVAQARHDFTGAITIANQVLAIKGDSLGAYSVLATSYLALGDLDRAGRAADTMVLTRPSLGSYSMRALVMAAQGRDREALDDFESAFRVEDYGQEQDAAWTRCMLARFHMDRGHYSDASRELKHALELVPRYHLALSLASENAYRQTNWKEADRLAHEAFESSHLSVYMTQWARAKSAEGDKAGASLLYKQAEESLREDLKAKKFGHKLELAKLLLETSVDDKDSATRARVAEAVALSTEESRARPSADTLLTQARALLRSGDARAAYGAVQDSLRTGWINGEAFLTAAQVEKALKNSRRAEFWLARAREVEPSIEKLP